MSNFAPTAGARFENWSIIPRVNQLCKSLVMTNVCVRCQQECEELIVLWDGRSYCSLCLRSTCPALYSFYDDLVDKSLPLRNSYGPSQTPHAISRQVWIRNTVFSFIITSLHLPVVGSLPADCSVFLLLCVFAFWYFFFMKLITEYDLVSARYSIWTNDRYSYISRSCYSYPRVMVRDGQIEVLFYSRDLVPHFTFAPFPFRLVFRLSDVSLEYGDSDSDPFYRADPNRNREKMLMLNFAEGLKNIRFPKWKFFGHEYNNWLKSPYIVCATQKTMFDVWEDFFSLSLSSDCPRLSLSQTFE